MSTVETIARSHEKGRFQMERRDGAWQCKSSTRCGKNPPRNLSTQQLVLPHKSPSVDSQLYVKRYSSTASIANKVTSSSAKRHTPHQISSPYSSTSESFASSSSPSHHWTSIPIDHRSGGLQMTKNCRQTQTKQPNHSRRLSFVFATSRMTTAG